MMRISRVIAAAAFFLFSASSLVLAVSPGQMKPGSLTVEWMGNPTGIESPHPRLSWKSEANDGEAQGLYQTAYEIMVSSCWEKLGSDDGDIWSTGKVASGDSLSIIYNGSPLESSTTYWWKVRVWDEEDQVSEWSEAETWTTGIMRDEGWMAKWIAQPEEYRGDRDMSPATWIGSDDAGQKSILLRKEFELEPGQDVFDRKEVFGVLYFAANRRYEVYVNGQQAVFSMGMVYNPNRLRTVELSDYLVPGLNVITVKISTDTDDPAAFLGKAEFCLLDKTDSLPGKEPSRFGKQTSPFLTVATDESWQMSPEEKGNWKEQGEQEAAWQPSTSLFAVDAGPWGKVFRHTEKVTPRFQKKFTLTRDVESATLHISGIGFYEAALDGVKIGDKVLDPVPSKYTKTVYYSSYDLTKELASGLGQEHELDVQLGHGWYDVRTVATWNFDASDWRSFPRMIAQLDITYADGTRDAIVSDDSWTFSTGPYLYDCIRQGVIVDGNEMGAKEILGHAVCVAGPGGELTASQFPGTKITEEFRPASIREASPGVYVIDLGRNIAGWCRFTLRGAAKGQMIRFRYSERLLEDGNLDAKCLAAHFHRGSMSNLTGEAGGFQTDFYRARGESGEVFEPRFVYHGFKYVEVTGLDAAPSLDDISACIVHTDFHQTGTFECSNELINQIQAAALLSYRGNFVDGYPTDCPHREKNGWTGDANLAAEQAQYNWENTAAYEKWICDLRDEQQSDGNVSAIVPTGGWGYAWGNGPAWDSSLVMIPWVLYLYRQDLSLLEKNYDAMKLYVDYMTSRSEDHLVSHGLGDWVSTKTETPVVVTSTGYYYVDTLIVAETARLLGRVQDADRYFGLADEIRESFQKTQIAEDGTCANGSQTAQGTAIHQGLTRGLDPATRQKVFDKLVEAIEKENNHLDFGILGSKYVWRTLSEFGRTDLALAMILQETPPCWSVSMRHGEGTLWEDWGDGASRNHIMFGDVSAWFYQELGGIRLVGSPLAAVADPDAVSEDTSDSGDYSWDAFDGETGAFRRFVVAPQCRLSDITPPGFDRITWARAEVETPYGSIGSSWKWNEAGTELSVTVRVPVNTTAAIDLPFSGRAITCQKGGLVPSTEQVGKTRFEAGSGEYEFIVKP